MINLLDSVSQYLQDTPIVRQGSGYVARSFSDVIGKKASKKDYLEPLPYVEPMEPTMPQPTQRAPLLNRVDDYISGAVGGLADRLFPPKTITGGPNPDNPSTVFPEIPAQAEAAPPQASPSVSIDPSVQSYLEETLFPLTDAYGIPRELAAAQWAIESARGSSNAAVNLNNPFGLGPNVHYQSLEDAVRDYDLTLRSIAGYNKGLNEKFTQPDEFNYSNYTPEDLAWTIMFTDLAERRALEGDPLYGDPSASQYRYEMHSDIPDYTSLLMNTPEWQYYSY